MCGTDFPVMGLQSLVPEVVTMRADDTPDQERSIQQEELTDKEETPDDEEFEDIEEFDDSEEEPDATE